jgi:magnesium-transporting ATPase (P-type)
MIVNVKKSLAKIKEETATLKFKIIILILCLTQIISFLSYNFWFNSTWLTSKHIIKDGMNVFWKALKSWNFAIAWSALYSNVIFFFSLLNFTKCFVVWVLLLIYLVYIFSSNLSDKSFQKKQEPLKKQAYKNVPIEHKSTIIEDQSLLINECYDKEFYEDMANAEEIKQEETIHVESKRERRRKYL